MGRPKGTRNFRNMEYNRAYDALCKEYGNPMEFLFQVVFGKRRAAMSDRLAAARKLVDHDPVMAKAMAQARAEERDVQPELDFGWSDNAPDQARTIQ